MCGKNQNIKQTNLMNKNCRRQTKSSTIDLKTNVRTKQKSLPIFSTVEDFCFDI